MTWDWKKDGRRVLAVILAAALMALNIKTFVRTGDLFPGGVTGLTVLIQRLAEKFWGIQLPYSPINILLNAFPVYVGFRFVGKKFTLLSLLMILVSSFLTDPSMSTPRAVVPTLLPSTCRRSAVLKPGIWFWASTL